MILVIIINERDETMLQRTLGSGWECCCQIADCRADVCGFITGSVADCHSDGISIDVGDAVSQTVTALRFATIVLALIAAIMLMIMNLNQG